MAIYAFGTDTSTYTNVRSRLERFSTGSLALAPGSSLTAWSHGRLFRKDLLRLCRVTRSRL